VMAHLRLLLLPAALSAIACASTMSLLHPASARQPEGMPRGSGEEPLECTAVDQKLNFPSYWAGPMFEGLQLTTVVRSCSGRSGINNDVTYIYEDSLQIQSRPWQLPSKYGVDIGTDTMVAGLPATWFESGHRLEIHHPDGTVTVSIHGQARRIERVLTSLSEGPRRLSELNALGIVFESDCLSANYGCQGDRIGTRPSMIEGITIAVVLFLIGPFLAILFRPGRLESA
jgi:hypothetical protein